MPYSNPEAAPKLSDLLSLKGTTALVVGGAGLLGGEISHAFAELGAELFIASRDVEKCRTFIVGLERSVSGREGACVCASTSPMPASITQLLADVSAKTGGGLDILVNSGWSGRKNTFESIQRRGLGSRHRGLPERRVPHGEGGRSAA